MNILPSKLAKQFPLHRLVNIAITVVSLCSGIVLTHMGHFKMPDNWSTDQYFVILGERQEAPSTLIVPLDAEALELFPNTPLVFWGPHLATAVQRLQDAGARVVVLDLYLSITPEQLLRAIGAGGVPRWLVDYDQPFDLELAKGGVLLAAKPVLGKGGIQAPLPAREYVEALPGQERQVGLSTLLYDSDGYVRRFVPALERRDAAPGREAGPGWTLAALAVRAAFGEGQPDVQAAPELFDPRIISYCGPPGTIPRLSFGALFRETGLTEEEKAGVKDRIVFIGAEHGLFGDRHFTPYSRRSFWGGSRDMSGVEIHANVAETLLHPGRLKILPLWATALIWFPFVYVTALLGKKHSKLKKIGLVDFALASVMWLVGLLFFAQGHVLRLTGLYASLSLFVLSTVIVRFAFEERYRARLARIFRAETLEGFKHWLADDSAPWKDNPPGK